MPLTPLTCDAPGPRRSVIAPGDCPVPDGSATVPLPLPLIGIFPNVESADAKSPSVPVDPFGIDDDDDAASPAVWLFPDGLFPDGLFPDGLFPDGLFPDGLFPVPALP